MVNQFGYIQFQPSFLYVREEDIWWSEHKFDHEEFK